MPVLSPRITSALLVALGLTAYVALQPGQDEDLLASPEGRAPRQDQGHRRPVDASRPARAGMQPATGGKVALDPARMGRWLADWRERDTAAPAPRQLAAWASQQPPPPPPPPVTVSNEPAQAPRFPYTWVGRYVDDAPRAVIAGPASTWVLAQGDVLEGQWRIERITDRQMTLTYLPLQQRQMVSLK